MQDNLQFAIGEIYERYEKVLQERHGREPQGIPAWSFDIKTPAYRGALHLWLAAACVNRWVINMQNAHDYSSISGSKSSPPAGSGNSGSRGPVKMSTKLDIVQRTALTIWEQALLGATVGGASEVLVTHGTIKSLIKSNTWMNAEVFLQGLTLLGEAKAIKQVERMVPASAGRQPPLKGSPASELAPARKQSGRKRQAAGPASASGMSAASVFHVPRQVLPPVVFPDTSQYVDADPVTAPKVRKLVDWQTNCGPITFVTRGGCESSRPDVVIETNVNAWPETTAKADILRCKEHRDVYKSQLQGSAKRSKT